MSERILTLRELNRALLARQLLLRRVRLPVARAIERVGALQAQWPPSPHIALWSRLDGLRRTDLVRAAERKQVVKATLMRATLHAVSSADYLAYAGVYTETRRRAVERQLGETDVRARLDALAAELAEHASREPRSRPELLALLRRPKLDPEERAPWLVWYALAARAGLVQTPEALAWRRNTAGARFVTAQAWLGRPASDGDGAVAHLVRRYLAAFGPASRADASQWTGLPVAMLASAFASLPLRRFRDEQGRELFDLPRAPLPDAGLVPPPRFLPLWDSTLIAHADRARILPPEYRAAVIRRNGDILQTFLVDGFVAGTWRLEGGRVELEPFEPVPRRVRAELEREAAALAAFHA